MNEKVGFNGEKTSFLLNPGHTQGLILAIAADEEQAIAELKRLGVVFLSQPDKKGPYCQITFKALQLIFERYAEQIEQNEAVKAALLYVIDQEFAHIASGIKGYTELALKRERSLVITAMEMIIKARVNLQELNKWSAWLSNVKFIDNKLSQQYNFSLQGIRYNLMVIADSLAQFKARFAETETFKEHQLEFNVVNSLVQSLVGIFVL